MPRDFEARNAAGEDPATLDRAGFEVGDGKRTFSYMKAIGTQPVCTLCAPCATAPPSRPGSPRRSTPCIQKTRRAGSRAATSGAPSRSFSRRPDRPVRRRSFPAGQVRQRSIFRSTNDETDRAPSRPWSWLHRHLRCAIDRPRRGHAGLLAGNSPQAAQYASQALHLKVRSEWIAAASNLANPKLHTIRRFECHNLFMRRHNFLQLELGWACGLAPRAPASLRRSTLL